MSLRNQSWKEAMAADEARIDELEHRVAELGNRLAEAKQGLEQARLGLRGAIETIAERDARIAELEGQALPQISADNHHTHVYSPKTDGLEYSWVCACGTSR